MLCRILFKLYHIQHSLEEHGRAIKEQNQTLAGLRAEQRKHEKALEDARTEQVGYLEPDTAARATPILAGPGSALSHLGDRDGQAATKQRRLMHFSARGRPQSQNELSALRCRPRG